ncbi:metallophosphoesterase [Aliarcobacter cryaerophilus]|uniref:metallophosphoesterase n=1 Tax=Aliarcobacter cryaerophilus TaxID=28198 RepID=UPI003BB1802B
MEISFLHLTDLHFDDRDINFLKELRDKIIENLKGQSIDLVIFSGDLVYKPSYEIFERAYKEFLSPILESISLGIDSCYFTTGNHDINLHKRDDITFSGIETYIKIKNDSKKLDELITHKRILDEIEEYKTFIDNYSSEKSLINNNQLYTSYIKKIDNISIGIVSINSSLFMSGKSSQDYGSLYLPEDIFLISSDDIKNCHIKIVNLHHSFNWYSNKKEIEQILLDKFNMVFFGHEHEHDGKFILDLQNKDILSLHGTSLHHKDNSNNGYCIYTYNPDNLEITIKNSFYNKKQRSFNNIIENKLNDIDLTKKSNKFIRNQSICSKMYPKIKDKINKYLTINLTTEINHKDIENIFVNQRIVDLSEEEDFKNKDNEKKEYTLDELIADEKNILFTGRNESGKTTNLNMINLKYLSEYNSLIPIFLYSSELMTETTEWSLIAKISEFLNKYYGKNNFKIKPMLNDQRFVFLIDDIHLLNIEFIDNILKFNNKVIATYTNDINSKIENVLNRFNDNSDSFSEFKKYELKSLRKRDCNLLVSNIVPEDLSNKVSNKVQKSLSTLNLPSNPFIATLLTWMHLEKIDIRENEPEIIDIFLDYLLEKTDLSKKFEGKIDFKDKKKLLSIVAYEYFKAKKFAIKEDKILRSIINHFEYSGSEVNSKDILDYFYSRKILLKNNGNVVFSYRVFYYYFISLYMLKNNDFKDSIMKDKILMCNMIDELRYYSAMSRNDLAFIDTIILFMDNNKLNQRISRKKIVTEKISRTIEKINSVTEKLKENGNNDLNIEDNSDLNLTAEEEAIGEKIDNTLSEIRDNQIQEYNYEVEENESLYEIKKYKEELFALNVIASEFLKNFDSSVSFKDKNIYLNRLLHNYSLCIDYWNHTLDDDALIKKFFALKFEEESIKDEELFKFRDSFKIYLIASISEIVEKSLSTAKLAKSYKTNILNTDELNIFFFYTLILGEIDENVLIENVENFLHYNNNKILFKIIETKLVYNYVNQNYSSSVKQELYNLLLKLNIINNIDKNQVKSKKSMQMYIPNAKKSIDNKIKMLKLLS